MIAVRLGSLLLVLALVPVLAKSAEPAGKGQAPDLAAAIDRALAERWAAAKLEPAPVSDDAEFLRRVYLDLTGKVPSVSVTRAFLEDQAPEKRRRLVDRLLQSPAFAHHFADVLRASLLPDNNDPQLVGLRPGFEAWLRDRLGRNIGYDKMVREIVTAGQNRNRRGQLAEDELALEAMNQQGGLSPVAFFVANQGKPENLAGATARLFLGSRIECAQCHNHPLGRWKREQFWQFAAFFSPTGTAGKAAQIRIPNTPDTATAHFLDGKEPVLKGAGDSRATLAEWITAADNPYFARTTVNRVWAYFLGAGLIEPVEDLTRENEKDPLLDDLASQFIGHGYDFRFLIRGIVLSRAYGLTSRGKHANTEEARLFARMPVRGLAPEQIFDSLVEATGYEGETAAARADFLTRFANATERPTEFETSILQALHLMNGKFLAEATSPEHGVTLASAADAPFFKTADRVEVVYLAVLSRKPRADESARFVQYVDRGGPTGDKRQALADVFWVLLNSSEFILNH